MGAAAIRAILREVGSPIGRSLINRNAGYKGKRQVYSRVVEFTPCHPFRKNSMPQIIQTGEPPSMSTMNNILLDLTPSALIQAIEANAIESFESWCKWANMELHKDPEITWTASDIPYFLFNLVLNLVPQSGGAPAEAGPAIAAAMSRASSRRVPMGCWGGTKQPDSRLG